MTKQRVKEILDAKKEEQVEMIMKQSIELQCKVAGTMPYRYFEILGEQERKNQVNDAIAQMPKDIFEEILVDFQS